MGIEFKWGMGKILEMGFFFFFTYLGNGFVRSLWGGGSGNGRICMVDERGSGNGSEDCCGSKARSIINN